MKVVLLKSCVKNSGGLEKAAARIAEGFVNAGADVSILTSSIKNAHPFGSLATNVTVHSLNTPSWPRFLQSRKFDTAVQKWLKNYPSDIVFGMDRNRFQTHLRAGNGVHSAYLKSRIHSEGLLKYVSCKLNPMHQNILRLEKQAFESTILKKIFTNSHMVKREILDCFAVDDSKISVIHNGVEWEEMNSDFASWPEQKKLHCRSLNLNPDHFHLLFVGHGYLRKGLPQLLTALSLLKNKEVHLSVVGKDRNQLRYEAEADKLGLKNRVHFFGNQLNVRPFYQVADVLAIPSFYDPFANVTVEALAMGVFVLSSKSNGGSEVLTPETGVIIDDLLVIDSIVESLEKSILQTKTLESSLLTRNSVSHLDYRGQMKKLIGLSFA